MPLFGVAVQRIFKLVARREKVGERYVFRFLKMKKMNQKEIIVPKVRQKWK